jgi:hypothetical protein
MYERKYCMKRLKYWTLDVVTGLHMEQTNLITTFQCNDVYEAGF